MERNQNLITKGSSLRTVEGTYGRLLPLLYSQSPSRPCGEPTRSPRSAAVPAVGRSSADAPPAAALTRGPSLALLLLSPPRTTLALPLPILLFPELLILFLQRPLLTFLAADFAVSPLSLRYTLRGNQIDFLDPLQYRTAPRAESFLASL